MTSAALHVPDISCEHCERTITRALARTPGVRHVDVNMLAKEVRVSYDEATVSMERIKTVLEEEAYPVASVTPIGG